MDFTRSLWRPKAFLFPPRPSSAPPVTDPGAIVRHRQLLKGHRTAKNKDGRYDSVYAWNDGYDGNAPYLDEFGMRRPDGANQEPKTIDRVIIRMRDVPLQLNVEDLAHVPLLSECRVKALHLRSSRFDHLNYWRMADTYVELEAADLPLVANKRIFIFGQEIIVKQVSCIPPEEASLTALKFPLDEAEKLQRKCEAATQGLTMGIEQLERERESFENFRGRTASHVRQDLLSMVKGESSSRPAVSDIMARLKRIDGMRVLMEHMETLREIRDAVEAMILWKAWKNPVNHERLNKVVAKGDAALTHVAVDCWTLGRLLRASFAEEADRELFLRHGSPDDDVFGFDQADDDYLDSTYA